MCRKCVSDLLQEKTFSGLTTACTFGQGRCFIPVITASKALCILSTLDIASNMYTIAKEMKFFQLVLGFPQVTLNLA